MPDWVHALIFTAIWGAVIALLVYLMDLMGLLIGFVAGRMLAFQVVSRLPGFWGNKESKKQNNKGH